MGRFCLNCGHLIGAPVPPSAIPEVEPVTVAHPPPAPEPAPAPSRPSWDPAEDLLPFDDDTRQGTGTTGLSGWAMLGWVVGAALLVGLVVVLLRVFGVDGAGPQDTATDPAASEGSGADEDSAESTAEGAPETVGRAADVARAATFAVPATAPATTDFDGQLVAYTADQMRDGLPATTWRTAGDASGAVITVTLRRPTVVSRVGLINGYAKQVRGVDWYPNNRRILAAQWGFDDGTSLEQTFTERPDLQQMEVPAVLTSTVTLTISSVTPPGPGSLGRDYTAISEVAITGRRAR